MNDFFSSFFGSLFNPSAAAAPATSELPDVQGAVFRAGYGAQWQDEWRFAETKEDLVRMGGPEVDLSPPREASPAPMTTVGYAPAVSSAPANTGTKVASAPPNAAPQVTVEPSIGLADAAQIQEGISVEVPTVDTQPEPQLVEPVTQVFPPTQAGTRHEPQSAVIEVPTPVPVDRPPHIPPNLPVTRIEAPKGFESSVMDAFTPPVPTKWASFGPLKLPKTAGELPITTAIKGDAFIAEGLDIKYAADPNAQYGRSASANAEPFKGLVFHYTGNDDAKAVVKYGHSVDVKRGGSFGYHFYVDKDGTIIQGAPISKRTNHIGQENGLGLTNRNAIGISMVGTEENPTPAQLRAAHQLSEALIKQFGFDRSNALGHGEARGGNEGTTLASLIRGVKNK